MGSLNLAVCEDGKQCAGLLGEIRECQGYQLETTVGWVESSGRVSPGLTRPLCGEQLGGAGGARGGGHPSYPDIGAPGTHLLLETLQEKHTGEGQLGSFDFFFKFSLS